MMGIEEIRQKLHQFIDTIEDKKAEAMYALFKNDIEEDDGEYTDEFKAELDDIYEYYEKGGEMVSPEEVEKRINALRKAKNSL